MCDFNVLPRTSPVCCEIVKTYTQRFYLAGLAQIMSRTSYAIFPMQSDAKPHSLRYPGGKGGKGGEKAFDRVEWWLLVNPLVIRHLPNSCMGTYRHVRITASSFRWSSAICMAWQDRKSHEFCPFFGSEYIHPIKYIQMWGYFHFSLNRWCKFGINLGYFH